MFLVRTVRVADASLQTFTVAPRKPNVIPSEIEGVRLKAESLVDVDTPHKSWPHYLDWASVHANIDLANASVPGKELVLVLMERPRTNVFEGAVDSIASQGRVSLPDGNFRHFTIALGIGDDPDSDIEVRFHGDEAAKFVAMLIDQWFTESPAEANKRAVPASDLPRMTIRDE